MLELLLDRGANIDQKDSSGEFILSVNLPIWHYIGRFMDLYTG